MADATGVIMTSVVITTGSTLVAEQQTDGLTFKPIVGGWLLGLFLFVIATFDPDIAKAFAILIMVTAVLVNGSKVFTTVGKATTGGGIMSDAQRRAMDAVQGGGNVVRDASGKPVGTTSRTTPGVGSHA